MNLLRIIPNITKKQRLRQVISDSWSERELILKPDINLFCWKRPPNLMISNYLEGLLEKELKLISFYTSLDELAYQVNLSRKIWDQHAENQHGADEFWADVMKVAYDFISSCTKEKTGTVRLKLIEGNECRKYHTDRYPLRLFTTYYGSGTEWLPERAVNRPALGNPNAQVLRDPSLVQQMETFEVGILKGEFHNRTKKSSGIVHRSPQIEGSGEKRVILRIDV